MKCKKILVGILLLFIMAAAASADWNMFRYDLSRTGYTSESGPMSNNSLWSFMTGDLIFSSPVAADNRVFFGSKDSKLYALNASPFSMPDENRLIWNFTAVNLIYSSPAVAEGKVFFGSARKVYGLFDGYLNETTGQWANCNTLNPEECSVVGDAGWCKWNASLSTCVYGYDSRPNGVIYSLNESDGRQIWNFSTGGSTGGLPLFYSSPAVFNGVVFIGSSNFKSRGRVYALNSSTGRLIWNYTIEGGDIKSSPVFSGGMVFVGSDRLYINTTYPNPGRIYALNSSTGEFVWSYAARNLCGITDDTRGTIPCSVFSSPAIFGNKVFFGSYDGYVYALDKSNGSLLWDYATGNYIRSSPAVAYGKVFIGSSDGKLYALNESNGNLIWNYTITVSSGMEIMSSPSVSNNVVYVGGGNNNVYAFNASTGKLMWTYATAAPVDSSPAIVGGAEDGMLFIGSGDGKLYSFGTLYPDLIIGNLSVPSNIRDGQIALINASIKNPGEGDAEFKVSFYYDLTGPAYLIGNVSGSIMHFGEENLSVWWDTAGKAGNHTIYAYAEVTSNIGDENSSNNLISKSIEVGSAGRTLRVIPHYNRVNFGSDFTVYLGISSDAVINGTTFNLLFNSSILNLTKIAVGGFFTPVNYSNYSSITGDLLNVTLNFTSNNPANGTGILAEITFNAKKTGLSALNFERVNFYNDTGILPDALPVGGEINVCIEGDVNCDCIVDVLDLMIVARSFHTKYGDLDYDSRSDLKMDNFINVFDLAVVGRNFGSMHQPCR